MKIIYCIIIIFVLFFCSCENKRTIDNDNLLIGVIDKAYINRHYPINKDERSSLFLECEIMNYTDYNTIFKFRYDAFNNEMHNLYAITRNNDSLSLFCRYQSDKIVEVQPKQKKKVDFCIDFTENLFKESHSNDYLAYVDNLASIIDKIVYEISNDSTFVFTKNVDFVMEHRLLEYYSIGIGYKE